jgi:hypothetical protein
MNQNNQSNFLGQNYKGVMVGSNDPNLQNSLNTGQTVSNQNSALGSYDYPRMEDPALNANPINNQNQLNQPVQQEMNVGYYYGFGLGPQLRRNN